MWRYALRRLVYAVPILLGVSIVVFALITMAPGDAADLLIPPETPKEVAAQIRAKLGLDQPIYVQYVRLARPHGARRPRHLHRHQ